MEETRLGFTVSLAGRPAYDAVAGFDNRHITSGERVPLGRHRFTIWEAKAEAYSTNLFVWYGGVNLGDIALKRAKGTLAVTANPPAALITIQGPEFSLTLTNSAGVSTSVPTDRYTVEASYAHSKETREVTVDSTTAGAATFAPRLGAVELACNQSGATFQVFNAKGELVESGEFPALLLEMPEESYKLIAWHYKNKKEQMLSIKAGITNHLGIEFEYGAALLETDPSGAAVVTSDGHQWGVTPLLFSPLLAGEWKFQLRLSGYLPVTALLEVDREQTNIFSTNLVSINYGPAITAARQDLSAGDYDGAFAATRDALQVKPNDKDAIALQNEALGREHLRQAESLGKRGDYIGANRELEMTLESLPDNEEAKQLLADFKQRETEQKEQLQQERQERGKKLFDSALSHISDADLFESHEITTGKPVKEVQTAILDALKIHPEFRVTKSLSNVPETFEIEAVQELSTIVGTIAGRRACVIVGAQTKDDETQILFKVLEYKTDSANKVLLDALLNTPAEVKYLPVHPSRIPNFTDKLKAQVEEGLKMVTDRIQRAIGGESKR